MRTPKQRTPKQVIGDFLISLAVIVWTFGGAFGAYQVLAYLYDRAGWIAVACGVVLLPFAMAIIPPVALLRDGTWALFAGTWDVFMLGWILQLAGGLIADRPRSGDVPHEGDAASNGAGAAAGPATAPLPDDTADTRSVESRAAAEGE